MTLPKTLFWIALVTFSVFLYAHGEVSKVLLLYDIQHSQKEKETLHRSHMLLRAEVCTLVSPPSLKVALAKQDLRLEFPKDRQVVRLAMEEKVLEKKKHLFDWISVTRMAEAGLR